MGKRDVVYGRGSQRTQPPPKDAVRSPQRRAYAVLVRTLDRLIAEGKVERLPGGKYRRKL